MIILNESTAAKMCYNVGVFIFIISYRKLGFITGKY